MKNSIFDEVIDRRRSNSMKWSFAHRYLSEAERKHDPLPMWVADMDFKAPLPIREALANAVEFGIYGYTGGPTRSYLAAVCDWQRRRYDWDVDESWVVPIAGVIPAIKAAIQAFTVPGDRVLIQPPVYGHFFDDPMMNGRRLSCAPLRRAGNRYVLDLEAFERAIEPDTRLFILSNPHNPTGNVWSVDELRAIGDICAKHSILVLSDEIHSDFIVNADLRHTPFASLGASYANNSITCTSPAKTFNLAGLQNANIFIPDKRLREAFRRQVLRNAAPLVNLFGMVACESAYRECDWWVDELVVYLRKNHSFFSDSMKRMCPGIEVLPMDSLYLAWVDCSGLGLSDEALKTFMLCEARVWFDQGLKFGAEGSGHLRVNLGCPRVTLGDAVDRVANALHHLSSQR